MDKSKWEYKKLGDCCKVINGLWTGKKPPFINVGVIRNANFTKSCELDNSNIAYIDVEQKAFEKRKLIKGDIIIEKSGGSDKQPVGRPILFNMDGDFSFSNFTSTLRVEDCKHLDSKYLHKVLKYNYLMGHTKAMQSNTTGLHNLDFTKYKAQIIPIPPISDQQRIVAELDCLNEMIALKQEQLKEFDKLAQSIFYDMFGDPISNEKGWEKNKLDELYKVTSSKRILQSEWQDNGVPFYKVADIVNLIDGKTVIPSTFIKESTYNELISLGLVPNSGDILITSRGTLGECYIVLEGDKFYFQDGMITWLSQKANNILPIYLKSVFGTKSFLDSLLHNANMSTVAYLSIGQLSKVLIPLPPLALQQQFAEKIQAIEAQKELVKQSIAETQSLFNSRMDYFFN